MICSRVPECSLDPKREPVSITGGSYTCTRHPARAPGRHSCRRAAISTEYHPSGILDTICQDRQQNAASSLSWAKQTRLAGKHTCACATSDMIPVMITLVHEWYAEPCVFSQRSSVYFAPHSTSAMCRRFAVLRSAAIAHHFLHSANFTHRQGWLPVCLGGCLSQGEGDMHLEWQDRTVCLCACVCTCEKVCVFVYPQLSIQWFWFGRYNHLQTRSCVSPHVLLMSSTTYPVVVQTNKGTDSEAPPPQHTQDQMQQHWQANISAANTKHPQR